MTQNNSIGLKWLETYKNIGGGGGAQCTVHSHKTAQLSQIVPMKKWKTLFSNSTFFPDNGKGYKRMIMNFLTEEGRMNHRKFRARARRAQMLTPSIIET